MNKQGLVQKEVQVRGKNGKMFTRKQWVKASDVAATGSLFSEKLKAAAESNGKHSLEDTVEDAPLGTTIDLEFSVIENSDGSTTHHKIRITKTDSKTWEERGSRGEGKLNNTEVTYMLKDKRKSWSIFEGSKSNTKAETKTRQTSTDSKSASDTVKFDKTKSGKVGGIQIGKELATVIKTVPTGAKKLREVTDKDTGKTYSIYTDTSSNKPDGIVAVENQSQPKIQSNQKDLSKMSESELKDRMKQVTTRMSELSKEMNNNTKAKGQLNAVATSTQKKEYDDLVEENGKILVELGKRQKQSDTSQQPTGQKLSKEDAKKKTQSYTNKVGKTDSERNAFMDKVRAQGITWKEKNDNGTEVSVGINWMRCCMAMNKHFANGGSFNEK